MASDIGARVRAKFPLDEAVVEAWSGKLDCPWCGCSCSIIAGFRVSVGQHVSFFNLATLGELELHRPTHLGLGPIAEAHRIRWRESKTRGRQLLCNGCPECGSILGEDLDFGDWACRERLGSFTVPLDMMWRRAMFGPGDLWEPARRNSHGQST